MKKSDVIALRDSLKANKNIPLRILIDNAFVIVDENMKFQFTKWDDDNGILYSVRLTDPLSMKYPNDNMTQCSVLAISYEFIQTIEAPRVFVNDEKGRGDLKDILDNIPAFGTDFKNLILNSFNYINNKNTAHITPTTINDKLSNPDFQSDVQDYAVSRADDYVYTDGKKFVQSYKETAHVPYTHETAVKNDEDSSENEDDSSEVNP